MQRLLLLLASAALAAACSSARVAESHGSVPDRRSAAAFLSERTVVVRFSGSRPMHCRVVSEDGMEWAFVAGRDGDSIDLSGLFPGEYAIYLIDGASICFARKIRLK